MELQVVSLRTGQQVYSQGGIIYFPDFTDVVNVSIRVRTIEFPHRGYYLFRLFLDGVPIRHAECRLRVYQSEVTE